MQGFSIKKAVIATVAACAAVTKSALAQDSFGFVGANHTYVSSNDGEAVNLFNGTGLVGGNDTLGYTLGFTATFTAIDPSAANCSMAVGNQTLVLGSHQANGTLPILNITSEGMANQTLANFSSICYGNDTLAISVSALNGETSANNTLLATQDNYETPAPSGDCVNGTVTGVPLMEKVTLGKSFTTSGIGFKATGSGDVTPFCDFSQVSKACPDGWNATESFCEGKTAAAEQLPQSLNNVVVVNQKLLVGKSGEVNCYLKQEACPIFGNFTLAKVLGIALEQSPQAAL